MAWTDAYPTPASTLSTMAQWEALFGELAPSGVIQGVGSELAVSVNSGARTATIGTGGALVRGFRTGGDTTTTLPIPAADSQARIDRLVLRLDRAATLAPDWIEPVIIEGTPSSTPQIPAITRDSGAWDFQLARWTANSNGTISGLVDERVKLTPTLAFPSTARPTLAGPGYGLETDTGRPVYTANGSSWSVLAEDTGWVTVSANGPNAIGWPVNDTKIRKRNGIVHLRISTKRWNDSAVTTSDPDGSVPYILPAAYRPIHDEIGFGLHSRSPVAVRVETDGSVRLFPLVDPITAGRTVTASVTWMTG